jgi:hypothetical protein
MLIMAAVLVVFAAMPFQQPARPPAHASLTPRSA